MKSYYAKKRLTKPVVLYVMFLRQMPVMSY